MEREAERKATRDGEVEVRGEGAKEMRREGAHKKGGNGRQGEKERKRTVQSRHRSWMRRGTTRQDETTRRTRRVSRGKATRKVRRRTNPANQQHRSDDRAGRKVIQTPLEN